jgi:Rrf2 family protein
MAGHMRLSTKIRYGYRLMLDLAIHWGQKPVALKEISKRQEVSLLYLRQIIMALEAAGLVRSHRGSKGGYSLAHPPEEIMLVDITRALEGPIDLIDCISNPEICTRAPKCATRLLWQEMSEQIISTLDSKSLSNLRDVQLKLEKEAGTS